jgi:concanavalin A-like lectin/glucanase superfamily protein
MSLAFVDGGTDIVSAGTGASLELDTVTILIWINPTSLPNAALRHLFAKGPGGANLWFNSSGGANNLVGQRARPGGTNCSVQVDWTNLPAAGAGKWNFWGVQLHTAGADADQKLFGGDLTTTVIEATTYVNQTVGTGTPASLAGTTATIGNLDGGSFSFQSSIASVGIWNRLLTLAEIQYQQSHRRPTTGCVLFHEYMSTDQQKDFSGTGNVGTVSGPTVATHVPIQFQHFGLVRF